MDAKDVRLLLRAEKEGVAGVVLAVQKLLLRVLLPVEDDELEDLDDELVPLLIFRILENAARLLGGGLEKTVLVSRHI